MDTFDFQNLGGVQMMGIVNAMKTGSIQLDMLIAMCIPILMRFIFSGLGRVQSAIFTREFWTRLWKKRSHMHERTISHTTIRNSYGGINNTDSDSQNAVLMKAIALYLDRHCKLNLKSAHINLTSFSDIASGLRRSRYYYDSDDDDDEDSKTLVGALRKYKIVKKPLENEWHKLGKFQDEDGNHHLVELMMSEANEENDEGGDRNKSTSRTNTKIFSFQSLGKKSIDTFVDTSYNWYINELRKLEDSSRYLYELQVNAPRSKSSGDEGDAEESSDSSRSFQRYKLSDEKTFESLFFQQKASMLKIVKHFTEKTGKYAIRGYPHKLGLLLHGPPGSGKTSLIKALAHHTGRSIINVPLSKISTNNDLMSIFFDQTYNVGDHVGVKLGFKDVVFVMEDVDAASKVVRRRDSRMTADMEQNEQVDVPLPKCMWRMLLESHDSDCRVLVTLLIAKSERLKKVAMEPATLRALTERMVILPGLGLIGESDESGIGGDATVLSKIGDEAIQSAEKLMNKYSTVDRFLGAHAKVIKSMLDTGAKVDSNLEDELLGLNPPLNRNADNSLSFSVPKSLSSIPKPSLSRDVSYKKYTEVPNIEVKSNDHNSQSSDNMVHARSDMKEFGPIIPFFKPQKDQLNLTGLLNVLDGVVDTPGRILIMTTNHPEMLDPALIRPGRIDKQLMLSYMDASQVILMLEHYFQLSSLSPDHQIRVETVVTGNRGEGRPGVKLTPAQVAQLAAEHDGIEEMVCALEEKSKSIAIRKIGSTICHSRIQDAV
uniref:AAA+ ATPase domain-containing protein n=1 Tax=Attheya septentrionalis TaxID=420275 RepID=A0A7S2UCS0_9STRA|mmetsp:Transcript_17912/g.32442  ORF Transcript_17912/g.32442 Transcript_17912/m.32442 type:complete len:770 (+) Transcript_17912:42-2351(+)